MCSEIFGQGSVEYHFKHNYVYSQSVIDLVTEIITNFANYCCALLYRSPMKNNMNDTLLLVIVRLLPVVHDSLFCSRNHDGAETSRKFDAAECEIMPLNYCTLVSANQCCGPKLLGGGATETAVFKIIATVIRSGHQAPIIII